MRLGESEVERQSLHDQLVLEEADPEDRDDGNGNPPDSSKKGILTDERQLASEMRLGESAVERQSLHDEFVLEEDPEYPDDSIGEPPDSNDDEDIKTTLGGTAWTTAVIVR